MSIFQPIRKLFIALTLGLAIALWFTPWQMGSAIAASLQFKAVSPTLATYSGNEVERRAKATTDQVVGRGQNAFGKATDNVSDRIEGKARQLRGDAANRVENLGDRAKGAARDVQQQSEGVGDRVKGFFSGDGSSKTEGIPGDYTTSNESATNFGSNRDAASKDKLDFNLQPLGK